MPELVYIALGSNLGDRKAHLGYAVDALRSLAVDKVIQVSSTYETKAVGPGVQENYYNAVVAINTDLPPLKLLKRCLEIEKERGRERRERWGPRTLDLDLLVYGKVELNSEELSLPHPRITERAFVLTPFAELAPDLEIDGRRLTNWLETINTSDAGIFLIEQHS